VFLSLANRDPDAPSAACATISRSAMICAAAT